MSKQQRRKGNAKNASSASAHGYLADGGAVFVGLTPEMNIFEVASSNQLHQLVDIDDETRIVMKKLTKKDALTREKGLKELIVIIESDTTPFEHFCGLVPQLATDGSPIVRMLTMKAISLFLIKLKKGALKGLKKIIPMVLFAKSDVTNSVAAAASAVIRDGFDADKKEKILSTFGPMTFEIAAKIAQGSHELCVLKEYDSTEDKPARTARLETQSMNVFLSFIREHPNEEVGNIWKEAASKLFQNTEFIKKTFTDTSKTSLKVQLLSVSYKLEEPVDLLLSLPTVFTYIQNSLDAQTFTPECATSWEGLILLIDDEQFQSKVSLLKTIYPRILNVVRKKGTHWRVLKHFLLPAVVVLLQGLGKSHEDSVQKSLTSILDSFTDNLPWAVDISMNAIHCWFHTFADFVRWTLSNEKMDLIETIIPLTVKMSEQSMILGTSESTECISELIYWIIEKIDDNSSKRLCGLLEQRIFEVPEKSALLRNALTTPGQSSQLAELHAHLINSPELVDFNVIRNLAHAHTEDYFNATIDLLKDFSFLQREFEESQAHDVSLLISKILSRGKYLKINVKNDALGRQLLLSEDDRIWTELFKSAPVRLFQEMSDYWHQNVNGRANAKAVSFLKRMGIELDTKAAAENVDFLISLLKSTATDGHNEEKKSMTMKLFAALFEQEEEPTKEHFEWLAGNLDEHFNAGNFFDKLFEEIEPERVIDLAGRLDRLGKRVSEQILSSKEEHDRLAEKLHFLELDVFTYSPKSHILIEAFSTKNKQLEENEAVQLIRCIAKKSLFDLTSQYHSTIHQLFGYQTIEVINALGNRYCLKNLDEELEHLKEEIEQKLSRSIDLQNLILENKAPNFLANKFGLSFEQERKAASFGAQKEEKDVSEKIETLFSDALGLKYLETVFIASQSEQSFELFQFNAENDYEYLANLAFVKQLSQCGGEIFSTENFELRDFCLCGMVSVLDNSADLLSDTSNLFDENPRLEAITANYMELFCVLNESAKSSEQSSEEWNEFYAPTIRTYFIRMFRSVRKEQQPTPFIRSLLKVLFTFSEFPTDVPNDDAKEFVPELAVFKYPQFQESCISQAFSLMTSSVEHIQLVGYAVARLLMPIMFKLENASGLESQDDTSVSASRSKLTVPVMVRKTVPSEPHPHLNALLFNLALMPLSNENVESLSQEHRVAYCEALNPLLRSSMNGLLADQPFDFMRSPMSCRIPKSQEREYYLQSDLSASPVFFEKFAARLLFQSLSLLPAAVRLYYKGMTNTFAPMFAESVTRFASRMLIDQELAKVRSYEFADEMKVRTVPVTGEIIADYVVDETKMKLTIGLPPDYPLSVPSLTIDNSIVKSDRAKKWLLQLNAYLFHQNGAILEGIEMWKRNVDKGVEGAEDCCICMMTVHQQTHQLPKVKCKQCKNKFHSNCLYKWFESSNQATCPLCRNNFT